MELRQKVELKIKGESADLQSSQLVATLSWKKAVDLDLYGIFKRKDGSTGQCYFGNRRVTGISLSEDKGVGDTGGNNIETMNVDVSQFNEVLIVANIFNKPSAVFASYDGKVTVKCGNEEFEVPLSAKESGSWCVIAKLDNSSPIGPKLVNVNSTLTTKPSVGQDLNTNPTTTRNSGGGLLGRIFG